ncbi:Uncharacterized protein TCM_039968 [Theobroma cacao]|uniref:Uncharacterized protein n=1 Tax=Theobroma cacao TaxID=3641 RepID=A0A061GYP3_THECC|nr:Uncharacterized protein TCM_039968 [Theobroma cacao]
MFFYETNAAPRKVVYDDDVDDIEEKMKKMNLENREDDEDYSKKRNEEKPSLENLQRIEEQHNDLPKN